MVASKTKVGKHQPESRDRVTLRVGPDVLERAERVRLAVERANRGLPVSENGLLRMALERGLDVLEGEYKAK
jgi:hypothetical protein